MIWKLLGNAQLQTTARQAHLARGSIQNAAAPVAAAYEISALHRPLDAPAIARLVRHFEARPAPVAWA